MLRMKKILIRMITYNQENVIRRALDSVLCQRQWGLYRFVVSDDCSKDRTWDILQEYKVQYPDIMEIYRNEHNLGIYGNVERSEEYMKGIDYDLYDSLAGDDAYCDGYFEGVQKLIETHHIDVSEAVGIYSSWRLKQPNGNEFVFTQEAALSKYPLWSLYIRGLVSGRSLMTTKKVHEQYEKILHGCGLNLTESHYDSQPHLIIKQRYYMPLVTTEYYSGIGVSTKLSAKKSDYATVQCIEKWEYFLEHYVRSKWDEYYAKYEILKASYLITPTWGAYFKMIGYFIKGQLPGNAAPLKRAVKNFINLASYKRHNS